MSRARTRRRAWAASSLAVVQAAGPAQRDRAPAVGDVVAEPEVARGTAACRMRLGQRGIGLGGRHLPGRPVRPLSRATDTGSGWSVAAIAYTTEPALEGLVEALDLALGLGMPGCPVLLADAEVGEQVLEPVAPAREARRVHRTLVRERGRRPAGHPGSPGRRGRTGQPSTRGSSGLPGGRRSRRASAAGASGCGSFWTLKISDTFALASSPSRRSCSGPLDSTTAEREMTIEMANLNTLYEAAERFEAAERRVRVAAIREAGPPRACRRPGATAPRAPPRGDGHAPMFPRRSSPSR